MSAQCCSRFRLASVPVYCCTHHAAFIVEAVPRQIDGCDRLVRRQRAREVGDATVALREHVHVSQHTATDAHHTRGLCVTVYTFAQSREIRSRRWPNLL